MSGGKTAATVLRDAVEVLRERGWTQNHMENAHGVCAVGAIATAAGVEPQMWFASSLVVSLRQEVALGLPFKSLSAWNDAPARTQAEVESAFLAAAARLDAGSGEQQ